MDHEENDPGLDVAADILSVDPDEMRRLGYWVVDRTIEHLMSLDAQPAVRASGSTELRAVLGGPLPFTGNALDPDLAVLADVALANQQHGEHPRYFARVASPASYPAILADWLGTGMQSVASSWGGGSGTTMVELVALEWLREAIGLAAGSEGVLLSGGSMANITGIITARHENGEGVFYLADQTHASIGRSLSAIGQPADLIRLVPTDGDFRMSAAALRGAIEADVAAGRRPGVVIATAGTTNTGAVDDLPEFSEICRRHDVWLHVDGAYGGPAAMSARGRAVMPGLDLVDSFVMDPHKWLFQPYDVACLFVRTPGALERTFAMYPEYLADLDGSDVDLHNRSLELSRRSRALKLWLTLRHYGVDTLAAAIERGIALAEYAQRVVESDPRLSVVTPAQLGIVTFAALGHEDDDHRRAVAQLTAEGRAAASSTVLAGRTVFRLCIINPMTTTEDLDVTIDRLASLADQPTR
jgi:glutamate/tyrosine decarboxylase-like PLP-dependent enzyme